MTVHTAEIDFPKFGMFLCFLPNGIDVIKIIDPPINRKVDAVVVDIPPTSPDQNIVFHLVTPG